MPDKETNLQVWSNFNWSNRGEEWSMCWGGTENLWWSTIFPRIQAYLPAENILEIAPGYGRCTQFLKNLCNNFFAVDLTERCIEHCNNRFSSFKNMHFYVNDGKSLDMINDNSIDFVFSWDSLVHVDPEVIKAYLNELSKKLTKNGIGFIHHSNFGSLNDRQTIDNIAWRDTTMTAELFREFCSEVGMKCVAQELIYWDIEKFTDCFSVFTPKGSCYEQDLLVYKNSSFIDERKNIYNYSKLYKGHNDTKFSSVEETSTDISFEGIRRIFEDIKFISKKRNICIWGAGKRGRMIKAMLNLSNIDISSYIDASPSLQGTVIDGVEIYDIKQTLNEKDKPYILIGSGCAQEIKQQLDDFGYKEHDYCDSFSTFDLENDDFDKIKQIIENNNTSI